MKSRNVTADITHSVVFADGDGGGNPCPVVFGAEDWTDHQMRDAAARLGHETAFVLAPREGGDVRLRYFVPEYEMEMCVHATVATLVSLADRGVVGSVARVETPLGIRRVWIDGQARSAVVEQFPPRFDEPVRQPAALLAALGIAGDELAHGVGPVQSVSTARPKLMVPLRTEAVLDALTPDFPALWRECERLNATGVYAFTLDAARADAAARQFPVRAGYDEDPATGVAAGALGAYLTHHVRGAQAHGWRTWQIAQARAMGRPSRLLAEIQRDEHGITAVRVGGPVSFAGETANETNAPRR